MLSDNRGRMDSIYVLLQSIISIPSVAQMSGGFEWEKGCITVTIFLTVGKKEIYGAPEYILRFSGVSGQRTAQIDR